MMPAIGLAAGAAALGSWTLGWWSAVLVGTLVPVVCPKVRRPALAAAVGTALGWGALLAAQSAVAPIGPLAHLLGTVVPVGAIGIVAVTLLFGAALAGFWAAAIGTRRRAN